MSEKKDERKTINKLENQNELMTESDHIENSFEPEMGEIYEIGFCCFCQGPCNPQSQSCGTCSREL